MQSVVMDDIAAINEEIAVRIGKQKHSIWFKDSTRLSISGDYLKVGVPNNFIASWIENHFLEDVCQAVHNVTGSSKRIAFSIEPELTGKQKRSQLDSQAKQVYSRTNPTPTSRIVRQQPKDRKLSLDLDNFIAGEGNRLAYNAARAVASYPEKVFNPLFFHGTYGVGKTHLLQGICNEVLKNRPNAKCIYVSAEEFTNEFVMALRNNKVEEFRKKFRQVDLLAIDDIHILATKKATQEEFLHTFNTIDMANKQVVLASDAHPKMIGQLTESLVNRFVSGMVIKVDVPDFETRVKISKQKMLSMGVSISDEIIEFVAGNIRTSIRELEGALLKLSAYSKMAGERIDIDLARQVLADSIAKADPMVHVSDIQSAAATYFGITPADLNSTKKDRTVSLARSFSMYLAREHTKLSFPEIGRAMGGKNHATVILACRKIQESIDANEKLVWKSGLGRVSQSAPEIVHKLCSALNLL